MSSAPGEKAIFHSSIEALTPEGISFVLSPAGIPVRTFALAIDKIIQWIIILVVYIVTVILLRGTLGMWLNMLLYFCVDWLYHVFCELTFRGQTPGKRLMGIRTVKSNGLPIDPASSFLRNLLRFADTFFFFFPIAFITMASSRGFRRIGDWAGDTLVVYSQLEKKKRKNSFLEKFKPITPSKPLPHDEKQAILSFARRYPLLGDARANEIAAVYAKYLGNEGDLSDAAFLLGIARKLSGEVL